MQNSYKLMKQVSSTRIHARSPVQVRAKLPPLKKIDEKLSKSELSEYWTAKDQTDEEAIKVVKMDEIEYLIKTSLKQYPKLEGCIERLKKDRIKCKCSVFTRNVHNLDMVHGFSSVACASEYCINRILEEPEEDVKVIKAPDYYSLITAKSERKEVNKDLILFEKSLDKINRAVGYVRSHKNSELEYTNLYSDFIKPPEGFNIPKHKNLSPNFSIPRKNLKL